MKNNIRRYSISERVSKVSTGGFSRIGDDICDLMPDILQGKNFKEFVRIIRGIKGKKGFVAGFGAHLIKCGLSPIIIQMMKDGYITALATNGASLIHDFEIAYEGKTSEDVENALKNGEFGMVDETCRILNSLFSLAAESNRPLSEVYGEHIEKHDYKYKSHSLFFQAYSLGLPVSFHIAIGTDIIHMHPEARGEDIGKVSMAGFRMFTENLKSIRDGGVYLNIGSAVIMPEVFLKALSLIRNLDRDFGGFTTAVFDFNTHYRPMQNVINRPGGLGARGFYFIGHHEIMLPLLYFLLDRV